MADPYQFLANAPHGFDDWSVPGGAARDATGSRVILHDYGQLPRGGLQPGGHNPYHLLVTDDGRLIQSYRPNQRAPHAAGSNDAYGIAYAGTVGSEPSERARATMAWLAENLPRDLQFETHGEAFQRTRGTPQQASAQGRGLDEASRWVGIFRSGAPTVASAPTTPMPVAARAFAAGMAPPPPTPPAPPPPVAADPQPPLPAPPPPFVNAPPAPAGAPSTVTAAPTYQPAPMALNEEGPPIPTPAVASPSQSLFSGASGSAPPGGASGDPGPSPLDVGRERLARQQQGLSQMLAQLVRGQAPGGAPPGFRDGGQVAAALRIAAKNTATDPTDKQKEAGNYAKGRVRFAGLDIAIENPKGSERSGVDKGGKRWTCRLPAHYGYFQRTEGRDGDAVDCYIGDKPDNETAWVIDQIDTKTGRFDEHKAMLGFPTRQAAVDAYERAFSDGKGKDRIGAVTEMHVEKLKTWLKDGDTKKPVGTLRRHAANGGLIARLFGRARGGSVPGESDMPLFSGKKNVGRNIATLENEGRPDKQAIAIALDVARRRGRADGGRSGYADGGDPETPIPESFSGFTPVLPSDVTPMPASLPGVAPFVSEYDRPGYRVTSGLATGPQSRQEAEDLASQPNPYSMLIEGSGLGSVGRSREAFAAGRPVAGMAHGAMAMLPYRPALGLGLLGATFGGAAMGDALQSSPAAGQEPDDGLTPQLRARRDKLQRDLRNRNLDEDVRVGLQRELDGINKITNDLLTAKGTATIGTSTKTQQDAQSAYNRAVERAERMRDAERGRQRRFQDSLVGQAYDAAGGHAPFGAALGIGALARLPFRGPGNALSNYALPVGEGLLTGVASANVPLGYEALYAPAVNPERMAAEAYARELPTTHPDRAAALAYARGLGPVDMPNPVRDVARRDLFDPTMLMERSGLGVVEGVMGGLAGANAVRWMRNARADRAARRAHTAGASPAGPSEYSGLPSSTATPLLPTTPPGMPALPAPSAVSQLEAGRAARALPHGLDPTPPPVPTGDAVARLGVGQRSSQRAVEPEAPPTPTGGQAPPPPTQSSSPPIPAVVMGGIDRLGRRFHYDPTTGYRLSDPRRIERSAEPRTPSRGSRPARSEKPKPESSATSNQPRRSESDTDRANREAAESLRRRGIVDPDEGRRAGGRVNDAALMLARSYASGGIVAGPVVGMSGGRADDKPVDVEGGSYVIPADCVAAAGDGNTLAGHKVLDGVFGPASAARARGGAVPIMISDGEHVLTREQVARIGRGNHDQGCRTLDKWVKDTRAKHIKHLKGLPGPAKG